MAPKTMADKVSEHGEILAGHDKILDEHARELEKNSTAHNNIWKALERIQKRTSEWLSPAAVKIIAAQGAVIGSLLTIIAIMVKMR